MCITKKAGDGLSYPQEQELLQGRKLREDREAENPFSNKKMDFADYMKK